MDCKRDRFESEQEMRISSAHKERGPGHAWLTMEEAATPATALVIERETDKDRYLGLQGWQSTPQSLPIEAVDGNRMLLGPGIVDYLKDGDFIKIIIAGTNHFEEDFWPVVPISGRRSSGFGIVSPQVMAADDQGPVASRASTMARCILMVFPSSSLIRKPSVPSQSETSRCRKSLPLRLSLR
jgi:hypothetical protein